MQECRVSDTLITRIADASPSTWSASKTQQNAEQIPLSNVVVWVMTSNTDSGVSTRAHSRR